MISIGVPAVFSARMRYSAITGLCKLATISESHGETGTILLDYDCRSSRDCYLSGLCAAHHRAGRSRGLRENDRAIRLWSGTEGSPCLRSPKIPARSDLP